MCRGNSSVGMPGIFLRRIGNFFSLKWSFRYFRSLSGRKCMDAGVGVMRLGDGDDI